MPSRLETLRAMVAQQPEDVFANYALAMELKGLGQHAEAWQVFESLLKKQPGYIAAYAPAADTLLALGRTDDARGLYSKGIEECTRQGQTHPRAQLETALKFLNR